MALFLDLAPSIEARLTTLAHARDLSISEFVKTLLERAEEQDSDKERKPDKMTPEQILSEGILEMKARQIKNRELTVQVFTHKNNLQAECEKEDRMITEYERKAEQALKSGNRGLAQQFFREKRLHERFKPAMQERLAAVSDAAEKVKDAIRAEEERIRLRTTQAMALKATLRQAKIEDDIRLTLVALAPDENDEEHHAEDIQEFEEWARQQETKSDKNAVAAQPTTLSDTAGERVPETVSSDADTETV